LPIPQRGFSSGIAGGSAMFVQAILYGLEDFLFTKFHQHAIIGYLSHAHRHNRDFPIPLWWGRIVVIYFNGLFFFPLFLL